MVDTERGIVNLSVEILLCAGSTLHNRNLQWKPMFTTRAELRRLIPLQPLVASQKLMEVFEVAGSGAGNTGRVCVSLGTAGLEAHTGSATTVQPGQDTTQPAALCFSFVVAELFQKLSFHSKRGEGKKKQVISPSKSRLAFSPVSVFCDSVDRNMLCPALS